MIKKSLLCLGLSVGAAALVTTTQAPTAASVMLAGLMGNAAGDYFKDLTDSSVDLVTGAIFGRRLQIDENHHILTALREAHLDALQAVFDDFDSAWRSDPDPDRRAEAELFSGAMRIFLRDARVDGARSGPASALEVGVFKALPDAFDAALAARGTQPSVSALDAEHQAMLDLREAALAEVLTQVVTDPALVPVSFEMAFHAAAPQGWFDYFVRSGAKALKENENFRSIWAAEKLALIHHNSRLILEQLELVGGEVIQIQAGVARMDRKLTRLAREYRRELKAAEIRLNQAGGRAALENDLAQLLAFILQQRVTALDIPGALDTAYQTLTNLRETMSDLESVANEEPELAALLNKADRALKSGASSSLDAAVQAMQQAQERHSQLAAEREESLTKKNRINSARILEKRAELAMVMLDYRGAEALFRQRHEALQVAYGEEHEETAAAYANLAGNLHLQGRYGDADPYYRRALEIRERVLGYDHSDTADSYHSLAFNLDNQGRPMDAEPLYRCGLEISERVLGSDHLDTARCYSNFAGNLYALGRPMDAEPFFRRALEAYERVLGPDDPITARAYNNVGFILGAQDRHGEAETFLRRALAIRERMQGPDHLDTANSYNSVASNLCDQGRPAEAEPIFRHALEIRERVLGPDHHHTAVSYHNLASSLQEQGRPAEAEKLYRHVLELYLRVLGPDHPLAATGYNNLALSLDDQGLSIEAEPLYRRALGIADRVLPPDHPSTKHIRKNLSVCLSKQEKSQD